MEKPKTYNLWKEVNREWIEKNIIPAGYERYNCMYECEKIIEEQFNNLLLTDCDMDEYKIIKTIYLKLINIENRNVQNLKPLKDIFFDLLNIANLEQFMRFMAKCNVLGIPTFLKTYVEPNFKNSERNILYLTYAPLLVPDKSYYFPTNNSNLIYLEELVKKILKLFKQDIDIASVIKLDKSLAEINPDESIKRQQNKHYFHVLYESFLQEVGDSWSSYFSMLTSLTGVQFDEFICRDLTYYRKLTKILKKADLNVLLNYQLFLIVKHYSDVLSVEIENEFFNFYERIINGVRENKHRNQKSIITLKGIVPFELGKVYVKQFFTKETENYVHSMVKNIIESAKELITACDWMEPQTKNKAILKLDKINIQIGYPNKFNDIKDLIITSDMNLVNIKNACLKFYNLIEYNKINKPVDKMEWKHSPYITNAYYYPTHNSIILLAGILQKPFLDLSKDFLYNYGCIGTIIGHEIIHAFDDNGRGFDENGNITDWWTKNDKKEYQKRAMALKEQFDNLIFYGKKVNGLLTLGENIADLCGTVITANAVKKMCNDTNNMRQFYEYHAMLWRSIETQENAHKLLLTDCHSPMIYRANIVRNMDYFYDIYNPCDDMFLEKDKRVKFW